MIQPLSFSQHGDYFLIPEKDYLKKVNIIYKERLGDPVYTAVWLSLFQWEVSQLDEDGKPVPPIIYTPTMQEVYQRLMNGNEAPKWQTLVGEEPLRLMVKARAVIHNEEQAPFIDNLGDGITAPYMYGGAGQQFLFVAEPIPEKV